MSIRIRGIYTTALTALLEDIVQASDPIERRFDEEFPVEPAAVTIETTDDRQGIGIHGDESEVERVASELSSLGRDTLCWEGALNLGGVYAGEVIETLGSGALVDCGGGEGFLPYSKTTRRIEEGDCLRVQVTEPYPPWQDGRPVLETNIRVPGALASLERGGTQTAGGPELADILPVEPPEGWGIRWSDSAEDASLDALAGTVESLSERADELDEAFADADPPATKAPGTYWRGETTRWFWFGRETRFELDDRRRRVTSTMVGHHRIKAGSDDAGTAVDFVEAICETAAAGTADGTDIDTQSKFPFEVVTEQFGPHEGDSVRIGHGKPDGRRIELGPAAVTSRDGDGTLAVQRELTGGGTYDALDVAIQDGDVAVTKFKEGRWWYPTVYRAENGETRGTYVNVCTPVEVFPNEVRYVDLHVDVVKHADGTVERVDEDELTSALEAGYLPEDLVEKARAVAKAVENAL